MRTPRKPQPSSAHTNARVKIISGGQTGADRAALDWALRRCVACGGWCPRDRRAEDGPIDVRYPLMETPSEDYGQRTEWNVRDSDATLILSLRPRLAGGSLLAREAARKWSKPCLHVYPRLDSGRRVKAFLERYQPQVLNIAGPRASLEPGVGEFVTRVLEEALG